MTTVVIPAHNEGKVIGRLLEPLIPAARAGELDLLVVANGCTDDTVAVASAYGPAVRVLSIPVASKHAALTAAYQTDAGYPRVYVDADVELGIPDIRALTQALAQPGILAAAPRRVLALAGLPWPVRWYYDVWRRLPVTRTGLWGRGVIAVSPAGQQRLAALPPLLGDDLAASLSFAPHERRVVTGARAVIHPPRTLADVLRRRVRVATGVAQIERTSQAPPSTDRTRVSDLIAITKREPHLAPRVALFLCIAVLARLLARRAVSRGDYSAWPRDDSSRDPGPRAAAGSQAG